MAALSRAGGFAILHPVTASATLRPLLATRPASPGPGCRKTTSGEAWGERPSGNHLKFASLSASGGRCREAEQTERPAGRRKLPAPSQSLLPPRTQQVMPNLPPDLSPRCQPSPPGTPALVFGEFSRFWVGGASRPRPRHPTCSSSRRVTSSLPRSRSASRWSPAFHGAFGPCMGPNSPGTSERIPRLLARRAPAPRASPEAQTPTALPEPEPPGRSQQQFKPSHPETGRCQQNSCSHQCSHRYHTTSPWGCCEIQLSHPTWPEISQPSGCRNSLGG